MSQQDRAELVRRLTLTVAALALYRLGTQIPLSGLNPAALAQLEGLAVERVSILALGVTPFVTILILAELLKVAAPRVRRWELSDARNGERLNRFLVLLALLAAAAQGFGLALALEEVTGLVDAPGAPFRLTCVATLVAGTALLIWLAGEITRHGLGSGTWLLFLAPLLADLPHRFAALGAWQGDPELLALEVLLNVAFAVLVLAAIVGLLRAGGGTVATAATCLWSVLIAGAVWPWIMLAIALLAGAGSVVETSTWVSPDHTLALLVLAGLVALSCALYVRSRRLAGETLPAVATSLLAGTLAAITLASVALPAHLARLAPVGGQLIIIAVVAVGILDRWRAAAVNPRGAPRG